MKHPLPSALPSTNDNTRTSKDADESIAGEVLQYFSIIHLFSLFLHHAVLEQKSSFHLNMCCSLCALHVCFLPVEWSKSIALALFSCSILVLSPHKCSSNVFVRTGDGEPIPCCFWLNIFQSRELSQITTQSLARADQQEWVGSCFLSAGFVRIANEG